MSERLRLLLQTALVAIQVVWFTVVGWIGATITLLPLAVRGGPLDRRAALRAERVRLVPVRRLPDRSLTDAGRTV
jgi:hypothetical protein